MATAPPFLTIEKCRYYEQAGVSHIFVVDPVAQVIYRWEKDLVEMPDLELPNGSFIGAADSAR